ncbi:MAG: fibronectin type III domain-containing protein [Deltaproteobacteria bacterium]|nr:fibronectin type III domain-containing protein [Deltaproteobacteria bacterium]
MESLRPRGKGVVFFLATLAICFICSTAKAKILPPTHSQLQSATVVSPQEDMAKPHYAQTERRIRVAVFTFNILNLGAAGYDATISNLFMTLLDQHQVLELMSRKELEDSLRRAGMQQSEDVDVVQTVGTRLGLDGIIFGNVKKVGSAIEFEVKFVEVSRGDTLLHRKEQVFGFVALRQKVEEITGEIVQIAGQYQPSPLMVQKEEIAPYPTQPTGLQARGGSQKVVLTWQPNKESNLRGYKVFRGTTPMGPFSKVASVTKNTLSDTDLENNRTYYYKVQAFNQEGKESPASTVIAAETAPSPFSPIILDATALIAGVRIRWTTNPQQGDEGTEVKGFKLYRATEPQGEYVWVASVTPESEKVSEQRLKQFEYEDSGLADGEKYYYRLTAFNNKGIESDFSSTLEGSTVGRPTGLQAVGDMIREVHLQWHPTPSSEVKGYRLYRNSSPDGTFERIGEVDGRNKDSYFDEQNLGDAKTYYYRMTVYDAEGRETGLSEIASTTTRGKPPTPEGLAAQSGLVKEVKLSWKMRPEEEVEGYYIFWNNTESGEFKQIGKVRGRGKTTFVDKGDRHRPLDDNATYYYMITSYNKVDVNSDPCSIASAITKPRPRAPTGFSAQGGLPGKVVLAWNPNPEADIKYYHLYRKGSGDKFKEVEKLPPDTTTHEDVKLNHGTSYIYRLQVEDEDKLLSDLSNTVEATTKPLPKSPIGLEVKPLANGFELKWKPNPEPDIVNYKIYLRSFFMDKEIGSTDKVEFTTDTLKPDDEYSISVTAIDKDGLESEKTEPIKVRTLGE